MSKNNYNHYLQKAVARKQTQPSQNGRQSPLRECETIEQDIEILDSSDLEIYQLLNNTKNSCVHEDELDIEITQLRKSTRTMFD